MITQTKREEIIKSLDNSVDSVKLEELFLYDLSPYYIEKEDDSFFSKQLEYIQEKNLLNHNPNISFTPVQIDFYNKITGLNPIFVKNTLDKIDEFENEEKFLNPQKSFLKNLLIQIFMEITHLVRKSNCLKKITINY